MRKALLCLFTEMGTDTKYLQMLPCDVNGFLIKGDAVHLQISEEQHHVLSAAGIRDLNSAHLDLKLSWPPAKKSD